MSTKEDNSGKESNESDYDEDKSVEEKQEEEKGGLIKKQQIRLFEPLTVIGGNFV